MVSLKNQTKQLPRKWLLIIGISLTLLGIFAASFIHFKTYKADVIAQEALDKADKRTLTYDYFDASSDNTTRASSTIILYGGGLVTSEAYAYLAASLAENGSSVYLLKSPFNLPILRQKQALALIEKQDLEHVYLIGHSLGGVAASTAATSETPEIKGLVLLASYPSENTDLSQTDLAVLSVTAEYDKVLNWPAYDQARERLPQKTQYLTIPGGNHSGFGLYGQQKGDGVASIDALEQQDQLITLISEFLP